MSIASNFLDEIKIGNYVEVIVGPKVIQGKVISLDADTVQILTEDQKRKTIALVAISYYEITDLETDNHAADTPKTVNNNIIPTPKTEVCVKTEKLNELQASSIFKTLNERNDHFFKNITKPNIISFNELVSNTDDVLLKNELLKISASIEYAFKQCHESSPSDYKISDNIAKLKRLKNSYQNSPVPYNCLGALYYECRCEGLSLDAYEKGSDFPSAFLISEKLNNEADMMKFATLELFYNKKPNNYLIKYLLIKVIENQDFSFINKIKDIPLTESNINCIYTFIRGLLISQNVNYNADFDKDISEQNLKGLTSLLTSISFKSVKNQLATYLRQPKQIQEKSVLEPAIPKSISHTLADSPLFAQAEKKRIEGNLDKAKELYIKAINEGQKPGSAVANLYQIFMKNKEYDECAKYLGKYGSKFMRSDAYANLIRQFRSVCPDKISLIKKYEKDVNANTNYAENYYQLAQKAELEEKNLQNAIVYYKKAIEHNIRTSASIPNLAAIYSRLEMYDDAINLLNNKGRKIMSESGYLNLKLNVIIKSKNTKYIDELRDTCARLLSLTRDQKQKGIILGSEAYFMYLAEKYNEALALFIKLDNNLHPGMFLDQVTYIKQKTFVLSNISMTYSKLKQPETAKEYATKILALDENNLFAKSVLSEDSNLIENYPMDDNLCETDIDLFKYIEKRIQDVNLETEITDKKLISKGKFSGSLNDAYNIYKRTIAIYKGINEEHKSNQYLAVAKILNQKLKEHEEDSEPDTKNINIRKYRQIYQKSVCIGSYYIAHTFMYDTDLESSKYLLCQLLSSNVEQSDFIYWFIANYQYFETYFCSGSEILKDGKTQYAEFNNICKQFNEQEQQDPNKLQLLLLNSLKQKTSVLLKKPIKTSIDAFVIGLMDYFNINYYTKSNPEFKSFILDLIFANQFQEKILDSLGKISHENVPNVTNSKEFEFYWDKSTIKYIENKNKLKNLIKVTIDKLFNSSELGESIDKLTNYPLKIILSPKDYSYLKDFIEILSTIKRYINGTEFDYKAETIRNALDQRERLIEKINDHPTMFSFEFLISEINERLFGKIYKESETFYGNAEPVISVQISSDCTLDPNNNIVTVPLVYTNELNHQTADEVEVSFESINAKAQHKLAKIQISGDGRPTEELVTFKVDDTVIEEKVFSIEVLIKYQYKKNLNETLKKTDKHVLSVPLYNNSDFTNIENKFDTLRDGHPVEDDSMFYGRDKEIEEIVTNINKNSDNKRGMCIAIYGQTRTGKSSILYHLEKKLKANNKNNIVINLGSIGDEDFRESNIVAFLYEILSSLHKELKKKHKELYHKIQEEGIDTEPDQLLDNVDLAPVTFNKIFRAFSEILESLDEKYNLILMIDEFTYIYDWIRQGKMTDRIMKFWKAFLQNNGITAVIIGQDHMMKFVNDSNFSNDFGTTDLRKITYLSKEDAQKLMDEPIQFEDNKGNKISRYKEGSLDRLYELTSGSPFLIGQLCAGLVEYMNENHVVYVTRAHIDDYIQKNMVNFEESRLFDPQYHDKSDIVHENEIIEQNKNLLRKIAQTANKSEWAYLSKLSLNETEKTLLENLQLRDVVVIDKNERCKIKVVLYKEWLLYKYGNN